jgi:hypothetical protein
MPKNNDERRVCNCPRVKHEHGTRASYITCECRCAECREAATKAANRFERQKVYGRSKAHQVDAEPARKHLKRLRRRGWGIRAVSKEIAVSKSTLQRVLYGTPSKGIRNTKTVKAEISERILAFTPIATRKKYADTKIELTDSTGSQRRIQALMVRGYSLPALAAESGKTSGNFKLILASKRVLVTTADEISRLYDRLWDKNPPANTVGERISIGMAKRFALGNGWLPPMAWDDDEIDDPKGKAVA